ASGRHAFAQVGGIGFHQRKVRYSLYTNLKFALELAKVAPALLEYVVVHELIHLLERAHNDRFRGLLDQYLPTWRRCRDELNGGALAAYEEFGTF
ncbi:MAG: YgjP-like metallopeptidase domain-containing protein, partial [Janthinobacterium lividum]